MTQKSLILAAATAVVTVTSLAVMSRTVAWTHLRFYGHFGGYGFAPWYAPHYGYAPYRYYDRFGSNLNPDRQMVGIGE